MAWLLLMLGYELYFLNVILVAKFVEQEVCTVEGRVHETWHNVFFNMSPLHILFLQFQAVF